MIDPQHRCMNTPSQREERENKRQKNMISNFFLFEKCQIQKLYIWSEIANKNKEKKRINMITWSTYNVQK